ncbi:hypothetical protein [Natronorubrum texcoconense]|uniref:Uncharacterized protein n=1 Tax=Natronorubrum texcoconense TaxID=1095776 RepID=A0A1G8X9H9_9EURY|nr:hypothetical protein [Natronorubrum texcoconense]SDJ87143.1 hypothetical protein SAMN04515672_1666 [Natronorubrum texcoconense]
MSASDANDPSDGPTVAVETGWFRFGVALAVLQLVFLALVIGLLQIDVVLGLIAAVTLSIVGGIAITVYVLWLK